MQKEAEDKDMSNIMSTSIGIVAQVSLNLEKNKKENKKMVINIDHHAKHAHEYSDKCV